MTTRTEAPWLSPEQQRHWRGFISGVTAFLAELDRELREQHDLTMPEYEILVRLSESEDRQMRMATLAGEVTQSRSRMTHTIARLEKDGIVARHTCAEDGRGVYAKLTDKGFDLLQRAAETHVAGVQRHFVGHLSPDEFATIGTAFDRVRVALGAEICGAE